jgi:two-component system, chemotaxis family, chemotaxis protein CheY
MNVLIVDDSEPMRRMIKNYIDGLTDDVFECSDGSEALDAFREHRPDVVLMDLMMSRLDGLAATRQIRQFCPEARIVIVTQWADAAVCEAARSAGAEASVSKADLLPLRRILSGAA